MAQKHSSRSLSGLDPHLPPLLFKTQTWLGSLVAQPFQDNEILPANTPSGGSTEEECNQWVSPSPTLKPLERVTLYHQQYWWRLLKCLHSNFPLLTRLFGYRDFNREIAIPYLSACPSTHWALCRLGDTLPQWMRAHYLHEDQELVTLAAAIDWAACLSFYIESTPTIPLSAFSQEAILTTPLSLQPHVQLFETKIDLFSFREAFLTQPVDYWNTHPFPEAGYGKFYFVLYRSPLQLVAWKNLSHGEHKMLSLLNQGLTINQACEKIEEEGGESYGEALEAMPFWFQEWTQLGWLTVSQ